MNIDEIKRDLEEHIAHLVCEFEERTRLRVVAIDQQVTDVTDMGTTGKQFTRWIDLILDEGGDA